MKHQELEQAKSLLKDGNPTFAPATIGQGYISYIGIGFGYCLQLCLVRVRVRNRKERPI